MTKTKKGILLGVAAVVVVGGLVAANLAKKRKQGTPVQVHTVGKADVVARVSCTGKVQAKRKVDISANVMGQIVNLAVREGDRVEKDAFLLQIDRTQLKAQASGSEAALAALLAERDAARANLAQATDANARTERNFREKIVPEAELSRTATGRQAAEASLRAVEQRIEQARAALEASRDSLAKTTIHAPMAGLVTALPVEEGEIAVIGTMNNAGTKLMTISDMSEVEAEMEVDETDVPRVKVGQKATLSVDALPDQHLTGTVNEIASSPVVRTTASTSQAVEFLVDITIDAPPESLRPGFSVSADIDTGEVRDTLALPVQALVIKDLAERIAQNEKADPDRSAPSATPRPRDKDIEGVFRIEQGKARFVPVKTGLQGDLLIELRDGLQAGDQIIVGPFRTLRTLHEGDKVRPEDQDGKGKKPDGESSRG